MDSAVEFYEVARNISPVGTYHKVIVQHQTPDGGLIWVGSKE